MTLLNKAVMELNYLEGFYNVSVKIDSENQGCKASASGYEITFNEQILEYDKGKIKELIIKEHQRCKHE